MRVFEQGLPGAPGLKGDSGDSGPQVRSFNLISPPLFFLTVHLNIFSFRIFCCVLFDVIVAIDLISCRDRGVFRVRPDYQGNQARGYELFSNVLGQEIFQFHSFSYSSPPEVVLKFLDFPHEHFSNDQCSSA